MNTSNRTHRRKRPNSRVLVIGGYGTFGKRLTRSLVAHYSFEVIIGGRSLDKAKKLKVELESEFEQSIETLQLDVHSAELDYVLKLCAPDIVVNASGPFQHQLGKQQYHVAKACIAINCHYVDLADDRQFVSGFSDSLNQQAQTSNLCLVTGASTVPALTCAVIDHYLAKFKQLDSISYGISPGNKTERGKATVSSILSYTGKTFATLVDGESGDIYGWQNLRRVDFGSSIGKRWMSNCEIPDLDILPKRYRSLKNIRFQAGLEVSVLHLGLWLLSFLVKFGMVKNLSRYSKPLVAMSEWFSGLGSDSGGMFIKMQGVGLNDRQKVIEWQLVAENGEGPNVPTIAAEILVDKISRGEFRQGAQPCVGLVSLDEFFEIANRWNIFQETEIREVCDEH